MVLCYALWKFICPSFTRTKSSNIQKNNGQFMCCVSPRHTSQAVETQDWTIAHQQIAFEDYQYRHLDASFPVKIEAELSLEHQLKIEEVRNLLKSKEESEDTIDCLVFVDTIQRLGVSSHFQREIEIIIQKQYAAMSEHVLNGYHTLHDVSLFFRLLRQNGYYISSEILPISSQILRLHNRIAEIILRVVSNPNKTPFRDVFKKFIGKDGKFKENLSQDKRGLMELYEASQLSIEGEDLLDEAAEFSRQQLLKKCSELDDKWSEITANKLKHPYHKSMARLTEKDFLNGDYKKLNEEETTLRELAIFDLYLAQSVYKQELLQTSRWWSELGLWENVKIARNQPVKWYTWCMACLADDISWSQQRIELTKPIAFVYLIDDMYDLCGTLDELIIFTETVNKWDYGAVDMLPDYMKMCYKALLDITNDIAQRIQEKHGHNPIDYLKTTWSSLCNAFLVEAKWFSSGELPTANEYLENGKVTSGVHVVLVHLFFLLLDINDEGQTIHLNDVSQLISSVACILRLWDDLGSAKDEKQEGKDGSFIECYMQDHKGLVELKQAREKVGELINREWKVVNKECLRLNHFGASSFIKACLNVTRMIPLMYDYDDNQKLPVLQKYVAYMLSGHGSPSDSSRRQAKLSICQTRSEIVEIKNFSM